MGARLASCCCGLRLGWVLEAASCKAKGDEQSRGSCRPGAGLSIIRPPTICGPLGLGGAEHAQMPLASDPSPSRAFQAGPHLLGAAFPLPVSQRGPGRDGWLGPVCSVSAPPLLTLMLPNGGPEEGKLRSQPPAPPRHGTQSQSLASRLAPEHSNLPALPPGF